MCFMFMGKTRKEGGFRLRDYPFKQSVSIYGVKMNHTAILPCNKTTTIFWYSLTVTVSGVNTEKYVNSRGGIAYIFLMMAQTDQKKKLEKNFSGYLVQGPGKGRAGLRIETDDKDLVWPVILAQEVLQGADRNFCRLLKRKTVGAAADGGKGNGGEHILCGNLHTAAIAVCQQGMFVIAASPPLRSDGMDNMLCRQVESRGENSLANRTTAYLFADSQQFRTGGSMDSPINSATAEQAAVCRINNGINFKCGDIRLYKGYHCRLQKK